MVYTYKRKPGAKVLKNYTQEDVDRAVSEINSKNLSYKDASLKFNIPVGTLFNRI